MERCKRKATRRDKFEVHAYPFWLYILLVLCSIFDRIEPFTFSAKLFRNTCNLWNTFRLHSGTENTPELPLEPCEVDEDEAWETSMGLASNQYMSTIFSSAAEWADFKESLNASSTSESPKDEFWEQVTLEATSALVSDPEAGPQLYQGILSQPGLLEAIVTVISHEIATELIPATALKNLFFEMLTYEDDEFIRLDLIAAATRSASIENAMAAILFHQGFHALVCYRVGHRLWLADRNGLAYYMQSTVSRKYSADIHPAARMGAGIHLRAGAGVVIGETAVVGNDCTILEGVTLGGTGKEAGDRHPKVGNGVTILDGAAVLGNIKIDDGSIILSKSIVTKPVPSLAIMSGVPAKVQGYRELTEDEFDDDQQRHLVKYLSSWEKITHKRELEER